MELCWRPPPKGASYFVTRETNEQLNHPVVLLLQVPKNVASVLSVPGFTKVGGATTRGLH